MKKLSIIIILLSILTISCQDKTEPKIFALIETDKGNIKIELFHKATPMTVANFVALAEGTMKNTAKAEGVPYFDGLKFHRVITKGNGDPNDFMIQGGDPEGTGAGGPGYQFPNEIVDSLKFDKAGYLAMANAGPHTNGSQFFITVVETPSLNGAYSLFGKVVEGMEVVNTIKQNDLMNKVTIIREGKEAEEFDAVAVFNSVKAEKMIAIEEENKIKAEEAKLAALKAEQDFKAILANYPNAIGTESGLYYVVEKEGKGEQAVAGKQVSVHYKGTLADGTEFDNSFSRGNPITFQLGARRVIPGWDEGIALMKVGSKYKLIIPYFLAYGEAGSPPVIPPAATLIFETELMKVE